MYITASVFINDDESGLHHDYEVWLEKLAPFDASPKTYRHNRTGEDNADAHLKRQIMGREVVVAVTADKLDLGSWEHIFHYEFDGRRRKRVLVKVIGEQVMCRYAMSGPYKRHYVCFACRKAFKQPPIEEFLDRRGRGYVFKELRHYWSQPKVLERREAELGHRLADLWEEYLSAAHRCPQCGEPMVDMGLDFKAPPQRDVKAWRTLHGMYRVGHAFHTCGCDGPGWIPKSTAEYRKHLEDRRSSYADQLDGTRRSAELSADEKKEAGEFWSSRIQAIETELRSD